MNLRTAQVIALTKLCTLALCS